MKAGAVLGSLLGHEQVEGLSSAFDLPSPVEALAGEQSPSRRRLAVWVAFTAQTTMPCLLQGKSGNCIELVLSVGSASWTAVCTVLPQVTVATDVRVLSRAES